MPSGWASAYRGPSWRGSDTTWCSIFVRAVRLQCKWGVRRGEVVVAGLRTNRWTPSGPVEGTYSAQEIDAFGIYRADLDSCYLVPITAVTGRKGIYLRLAPSRNNPEMGINWASSSELGAIAQLGERRAGSA